MLEAHVEIKPETDTVVMTVHCLRFVQLLGFEGEVGNAVCIRERVRCSAPS